MRDESTTSESAILERVVAPEAAGWSPDVARGLLQLRMPAQDFGRMGELAEKASSGILTDAERSEAEAYDRIGLFLELVQSRARLSLKQV